MCEVEQMIGRVTFKAFTLHHITALMFHSAFREKNSQGTADNM